MQQLLTLVIFTTQFSSLQGQTLDIMNVKSYADKIFIDSIKNNFEGLKPVAFEIRTTNSKGVYDYYPINSKKEELIPKSIEYLVTYKIQYPDLNFQTEVEILMDEEFKLKDSSAFENVPDYIKNNIARDIITQDSAIKIAKNSGLASGDTLTIFLFKEYKTNQFFWTVQSEWKAYYRKLEKEYEDGGPRRRRARPKDELFINAKTGEAFTYKQMPH